MMQILLAATRCALLLGLSAATAAAAPQGVHESGRFGFKFKPPTSWSNIALKTDEAWLAAKYRSNKSYYFTDPDTKYTAQHTPELLVIAFIRENMERTTEVEESEEDGVKTRRVRFNNPYKNYLDFLDRTYSGGGFYVDSTEKTKQGGLDVTIHTVKVEKLSRQGPKRILTWIYHTEDIDFAMQLEVLEGEYDKLRRTLERSLKSFSEIPRTGDDLPTDGRVVDGIWITVRERNAGTPKERRSKRVESQEMLHRRAVERLPSDWSHLKAGDVLVLSHTDAKYAQRVGDHAKAMLEWLDKTFPYVGKGEYVRAPIIRVCADQAEEGSFSRGVRTGAETIFTSGSEIVTHKDQTGWIGSEMDWVNARLLDHWMQERDDTLALALPSWLQLGMYQYVAGARADGRSINFRVAHWLVDQARHARSQGKALPARDLMKLSREQFYGDTATAHFGNRGQAAMLVRFLMSPEARRSKQAKDLLEEYITTLAEVVEEKEEEERKAFASTDDPETEEEEADRVRARAERWKQQELQLLDEVAQRVFGDWSERDWQQFEADYLKYGG